MLSNSPSPLQSTTPLLECKTASIEVDALQPEEQELANQAGTLLSRMANTEEDLKKMLAENPSGCYAVCSVAV